MGKGALRPFFKGHSLKKEKEHEKKEVDKMLSHFVTLPSIGVMCTQARYAFPPGKALLPILSLLVRGKQWQSSWLLPGAFFFTYLPVLLLFQIIFPFHSACVIFPEFVLYNYSIVSEGGI